MKLILIIFTLLSFSFSTFAKEKNFFEEAKKLFNEEKFEESKFLFQRNIVYNPKDSKSYLYLAKIFNKEDDKLEEEKNIKASLLLDPKNEEAMYLLIDMELERSNFSRAKELKKDFKIICTSLCEELINIENRLKSFEKENSS